VLGLMLGHWDGRGGLFELDPDRTGVTAAAPLIAREGLKSSKAALESRTHGAHASQRWSRANKGVISHARPLR